MRIFKTALYFFLGLGFFSSCSTSSHVNVNEKLIVGTWKGEKLLKYTSSSPASQEYLNAANPQEEPEEYMAEDSLSKRKMNRPPVHLQSVEEAALAGNLSTFSVFMPDFKNTMEFKADKTATLTSPKSTFTGTWKINGKGNKVTFIPGDKKNKIILGLNKIDSVSMEAADYLPQGTVLMLYKKNK